MRSKGRRPANRRPHSTTDLIPRRNQAARFAKRNGARTDRGIRTEKGMHHYPLMFVYISFGAGLVGNAPKTRGVRCSLFAVFHKPRMRFYPPSTQHPTPTTQHPFSFGVYCSHVSHASLSVGGVEVQTRCILPGTHEREKINTKGLGVIKFNQWKRAWYIYPTTHRGDTRTGTSRPDLVVRLSTCLGQVSARSFVVVAAADR